MKSFVIACSGLSLFTLVSPLGLADDRQVQLTVRVTDPQGAPIPSVPVQIARPGTAVADPANYGLTSNAGEVVFQVNVVAGFPRIRCSVMTLPVGWRESRGSSDDVLKHWSFGNYYDVPVSADTDQYTVTIRPVPASHATFAVESIPNSGIGRAIVRIARSDVGMTFANATVNDAGTCVVDGVPTTQDYFVIAGHLFGTHRVVKRSALGDSHDGGTIAVPDLAGARPVDISTTDEVSGPLRSGGICLVRVSDGAIRELLWDRNRHAIDWKSRATPRMAPGEYYVMPNTTTVAHGGPYVIFAATAATMTQPVPSIIPKIMVTDGPEPLTLTVNGLEATHAAVKAYVETPGEPSP